MRLSHYEIFRHSQPELQMKHGDTKLIDQINKILMGKYGDIKKPTSDSDKAYIALYKLANRLQTITEISLLASLGDYTKKIPINDDNNDLLSKSINQLTDQLQGVIYQANLIALGDFHEDTQPACKEDTLGNSLSNMTKYLRRSLNEKVANEKRLNISNTALKKLASIDPLTQIQNRLNFTTNLDQILATTKRKNRVCALLLIDIDDFKNINDTMGHAAGDQVLYSFAEILKKVIRQSDSVIRMGGDEFLIILSEINSPDEANIIAQNILDTLKQKKLTVLDDAIISASIGVACYPRDAKNQIGLLKYADQDLYKNKPNKKHII